MLWEGSGWETLCEILKQGLKVSHEILSQLLPIRILGQDPVIYAGEVKALGCLVS